MTVPTDPADSFPRRYARTQRFTLGQPRAFSISRDGRGVLFLRSKAGDDSVTCLWRLDVEDALGRAVGLRRDRDAKYLPRSRWRYRNVQP